MNGPNQLAAYLDFYDKNLAQRNQASPMIDPINHNSSGEIRPGLLWAQSMMHQDQQGQRPDFFSGQPSPQMPGYVRPQAVDMNAQRPQAQMRTDYFANDSLRPQVENYLKKLLGGMPAQIGIGAK